MMPEAPASFPDDSAKWSPDKKSKKHAMENVISCEALPHNDEGFLFPVEIFWIRPKVFINRVGRILADSMIRLWSTG